MRTIRWSSFLILPAAIGLVAMANPAAGSAFGIKGGLSVATLRGSLPTDGLVENGSRLGLAAGGWFALPLGPRLSIQPEITYVQKGTSLGTIEIVDNAGVAVGSAELTEAVDYSEFGLLLRFSLPSGGPVSPYFVGGPVMGFRNSQKLKTTGTFNFSTDIDLFESNDFGAALGAGIELGHGQFRGTFETRYTLGLTTASKDFYSTDARNGAFMVTMGLAIHQ